MLPSVISEESLLSDEQKKNIFFNTFPKTWRTKYKSSAHDICKLTIMQVKTYMTLKKLEIDRVFKRKKQEKDKQEKGHSGRGGRFRRSGSKGRG